MEHPFFVILSAAKDLKRARCIPPRRDVLPFAEVRVSLRGGNALSLRRENVLLPPVSKNGTCGHLFSQVPFFLLLFIHYLTLFITSRRFCFLAQTNVLVLTRTSPTYTEARIVNSRAKGVICVLKICFATCFVSFLLCKVAI